MLKKNGESQNPYEDMGKLHIAGKNELEIKPGMQEVCGGESKYSKSTMLPPKLNNLHLNHGATQVHNCA